MLTLLHIGSRLFELFGKEVRVKKQPGRPLSKIYTEWGETTWGDIDCESCYLAYLSIATNLDALRLRSIL